MAAAVAAMVVLATLSRGSGGGCGGEGEGEDGCHAAFCLDCTTRVCLAASHKFRFHHT